jgi:hypothetical protein
MMHELQSFEAELNDTVPLNLSTILPEVPQQVLVKEMSSTHQRAVDFSQKSLLTDKALSELINSDLGKYSKLTVQYFIHCQSHDPHISQIKNSLLGSAKSQRFVLKNNVVYRLFRRPHDTDTKLVLYMPTNLLLPTIMYIHKKYGHPSITQTLKLFSQLYYNNSARKNVSKFGKACPTCQQIKKSNFTTMTSGRFHSQTPSKPLEVISLDIFDMPTSSRGHKKALIVVDRYTHYLSLFPLKDDSPVHVAAVLRSYFLLQGIPKVMISADILSFQNEVTDLCSEFHVEQATFRKYSSSKNKLERQFEKFRNLYREVLSKNAIFSNKTWNLLFPLVLIKLNNTVANNIVKNSSHLYNILRSNLPFLTESANNFSHDLDQLAKDFTAKISKLLHNKQKSKQISPKNKNFVFHINEYVMRKQFHPLAPLNENFIGPCKIVKLCNNGVVFSDAKTSDLTFVKFSNLRKLSFEELINLLPTNFHHDILSHIGIQSIDNISLFNSKLSGWSDTDRSFLKPINVEPNITAHFEDPAFFYSFIQKKSCRKKAVSINLASLPHPYQQKVFSANFSTKKQFPKKHNFTKSVLKKPMRPFPTPYATFDQHFEDNTWQFSNNFSVDTASKIVPNYKKRIKSNFNSPLPGTLTLSLMDYDDKNDVNRSLTFSKITVNFY